VLTAAADAGCAAILFPCTPWKTASVVAAGALVYAGGVVLNDVADAETDRARHSTRPIPSGEISRRAASAFAICLLAAGLGAASGAGPGPMLAYAGVAAAALAYDFLLKRFGLGGALAMGLCRGGNVLAAALSSPAFADRLANAPGRALLFALPWLLHGFAVTAASLLEESPRRRALVPFAAAGILLPTVLRFALVPTFLPDRGAGPALALVAVALLTLGLGRAVARCRAEPTAQTVGGLVREGVFGFLLLDATVLGHQGRTWPAAAALALWAVVRVLLRSRRS
jgi:4-hydroxybenzoate polyprenyltransferase